MLKIEDFSLQAVKTFKGMEGHGFNANLMVKGKKIAEIIDSGNGGEMNIHYIGQSRFTPPKELADYLSSPEAVKLGNDREMVIRKKYPELYTKEPMPTKWCVADFVEYLLEKHVNNKQVSRLAKRYGLVYRTNGSSDLGYFKVPKNHRWTQAYYDKLVAGLKRDHETVEIVAKPAGVV